MKKATGTQKSWADHIVGTTNVILGLSAAFSSLSSIMDTVKDPDATPWDILSAAITSVATAIPMLVMAL
jgi:hypothetical protein